MRREQMIAWAAAGHLAKSAEPFEVHHHDAHGVNHLVTRENRGFNKGPSDQTTHWAVHVCYVTVCGVVVAVDTPDFTRTSKPPTCIACIGQTPRKLWTWDGSQFR